MLFCWCLYVSTFGGFTIIKFFKLILGFFTGGGAAGLASEFRQARKDSLEAANDKARLDAEERMDRIAVQMESQTRGEATWLPKVMRGLFAAPFAIYIWKLVVWDKVLKLGATDDLGPDLWRVFAIIITFYFLDASLGRFVRR